jgi:hypothetical protein
MSVRARAAATVVVAVALALAAWGLLVVLRDSVERNAVATATTRVQDVAAELVADGRLTSGVNRAPAPVEQAYLQVLGDGIVLVEDVLLVAPTPEPELGPRALDVDLDDVVRTVGFGVRRGADVQVEVRTVPLQAGPSWRSGSPTS